MIKPAVLDAMVAAGCTAQQIAAAVKADQAASSGADRQARYRARKVAERDAGDERDVTSVTVTDAVSPKKEIPPTPPKEKTTPSTVVVGSAREFGEFWELFPNKVGKRDAQAAFSKARTRADFETIIAGLRRYVAKTDDRAWCNPSTFLNQDRWDDQPAVAVPRSGAPPPQQESTSDLIDRVLNPRQTDAPFPGSTIDASFSRPDFGGAETVVRLNAVATRR